MKKLSSENRKQARETLDKAFTRSSSAEYKVCSEHSDLVGRILYGNHLTFKYVLVNALLAKATFTDINPLCLQKKSTLKGAYDARSLCHKVLVRFEREKLYGAFGNSNEPFLNKPARFPELSINNAVRKGSDSELLSLLCDLLPKIGTTEAFDALSDAIYYAIQISKDKKEIGKIQAVKVPTYADIENVVNDLVSQTSGGESLALIVGGLMNLFSETLDGETRVEVHHVNQAGSSSKEISDIDVYLDDEILYAIEAKDKDYTKNDVEHAIDKVAEAGCDRLMFINGPRGVLTDSSESEMISYGISKGVYLTVMNYTEFTKMVLTLILPTTMGDFFSVLRDIVVDARMKDETLQHLLEVARKYQLIEE